MTEDIPPGRYLAGHRKGDRIARLEALYFSPKRGGLRRHVAFLAGRAYWCICGGYIRVGDELSFPGRPVPSTFRGSKGAQFFAGKAWRRHRQFCGSELGNGRATCRMGSSPVVSRGHKR